MEPHGPLRADRGNDLPHLSAAAVGPRAGCGAGRWSPCAAASAGDPAAGEALIDQARAALGSPVADTFDVMPASALGAISMDPVEPLAVLNHTELLRDLTPGAIDALVDLAGPDSQSPLVMLEVRQLGGALDGPAGALSPMAHTGAAYSLNAIGITPTPAQAAAVRIHLEKLEANLRPHVTGNTYRQLPRPRGRHSPTRARRLLPRGLGPPDRC